MKHRMLTTNSPRELKKYEIEMIEKFLSFDFPGRDQLAQQALGVKVESECENCPTVELTVPLHSPKATVKRRIPVEMEGEDDDDMKIHYLLHIVDGYLSEVEVFREDSEEIQTLPKINTLRVMSLDAYSER